MKTFIILLMALFSSGAFAEPIKCPLPVRIEGKIPNFVICQGCAEHWGTVNDRRVINAIESKGYRVVEDSNALASIEFKMSERVLNGRSYQIGSRTIEEYAYPIEVQLKIGKQTVAFGRALVNDPGRGAAAKAVKTLPDCEEFSK